MKNSKIKISLLALLISQTITVANADWIGRGSNSPVPLHSEFRSTTLGYGSATTPQQWRATYDDTHVNRMFIETFRLKIPKGCHVVRASFQIRLKNLGAQNYNDSLYITQNGNHLYGQKIWNNGEVVGTPKFLMLNLGNLPTGNHVLTGSSANILGSLNDRKFSFFVQDDTSVNDAKLIYHLGGKRCRYQVRPNNDVKVILNRGNFEAIKHNTAPRFIRKISSNHSHNGRSHRHVLPAQGKAHRHGNGGIGR